MNTSLAGHQNKAIKECFLRVAATKPRSPKNIKAPFWETLANWGQEEKSVKMENTGWCLPAFPVFGEDCS